jgi:hypothetical protein
MPCVNCSKGQLAQIANRFPEHIERIAEWERLVSQVCRRGTPVSFFHKTTTGMTVTETGIHAVVEWSRTTRGGRQLDLLSEHLLAGDEPVSSCSSIYGLCE